jgi:hypothetical protein
MPLFVELLPTSVLACILDCMDVDLLTAVLSAIKERSPSLLADVFFWAAPCWCEGNVVGGMVRLMFTTPGNQIFWDTPAGPTTPLTSAEYASALGVGTAAAIRHEILLVGGATPLSGPGGENGRVPRLVWHITRAVVGAIGLDALRSTANRMRTLLPSSRAPYLQSLEEIATCCDLIAAPVDAIHVCRAQQTTSAFFRVHRDANACSPLVHTVTELTAATQTCSRCAPWDRHWHARTAREQNLRQANDPLETDAARALYAQAADAQELRASLTGRWQQTRRRMLTLIVCARRRQCRHLPDELWLEVHGDIMNGP